MERMDCEEECRGNDILNVMKERRSIRKFKPDMPSKKDLEQIIEVGLYAANARGQQATIIVAVTNRELRDRISAENCKIGGWEEGFDRQSGNHCLFTNVCSAC